VTRITQSDRASSRASWVDGPETNRPDERSNAGALSGIGTLTPATAATSVSPVRGVPAVPVGYPWHKRVPVSHPFPSLVTFGYSATPFGACRTPTCPIPASASTSFRSVLGSSCAVPASPREIGGLWDSSFTVHLPSGRFLRTSTVGGSRRLICPSWGEQPTGVRYLPPTGRV
jgi:hypothetical protein